MRAHLNKAQFLEDFKTLGDEGQPKIECDSNFQTESKLEENTYVAIRYGLMTNWKHLDQKSMLRLAKVWVVVEGFNFLLRRPLT